MLKLVLKNHIVLITLLVLAVVLVGLVTAYVTNPQLIGHNFFSMPIRSDQNWHGAFGGWL